ncbi:hypothetical protein Bca4012_093154 [Brassica carinata]|uniref:Uncharacterized protein n=1 Tax=Brassica carinata TaxID=52824 RepID=A0A8X7PSX5_BRACI|nr:hypothetical protein Bca52824_075377 [Brassica carinata]
MTMCMHLELVLFNEQPGAAPTLRRFVCCIFWEARNVRKVGELMSLDMEGAQVPEASQPEVVATGSDVKVDNPWSVRGSIYI